ncbi:MAG: hypothetical protein ACREPF_02510 [Rhodanobacteraceae bacterium]
MQRQAAPATSIPQSRQTRDWVADANLDAHPIGTWLLQLGFDTWIRTLYHRVVLLPDDFHIAPGTMIASNHQRDIDGPLLGTSVARRKRLRFRWPPPFYATREDLFRPGILARLTVHWPRPVSALLGCISLSWFFPMGHAEPMRRVREYTLGETLQALVDAGCGTSDAATLLNARGRRETGLVPRTCSVREAATRRGLPLEAWWGLRRLTLPALRRVAPAFRDAVDRQLAHFANRLDRGHCIYFSPEGTISRDGHFCRVRAGFFRVARMTRSPPLIQPMAIGYDTLAPGRSRVVVRVGPPFRADTSLDRRAFDAALRHAVLQWAPITPSHLLARWLLHGPATFSCADLAGWFVGGIAALRTAHPSLDPLFAGPRTGRLASERLRWLERRHLVTREGDVYRNTCARDVAPGWRTPANVVRYLDNNLADLLPDRERILPC